METNIVGVVGEDAQICQLQFSPPPLFSDMFSKIAVFSDAAKKQPKRWRDSSQLSRTQKRLKANAEKMASLPAVQTICCCKRDCLNNCFGTQEAKQAIRESFFQIVNDVQRKHWLKDLILCGVDDDLPYDEKHFAIHGHRICFKGLQSLFVVSSGLLVSLKGSPCARATPNCNRPSRIGIALKGNMFSARSHISSWLQLQKAFYDIQPDRDYVLLPYAYKSEVYKQYMKERQDSPEWNAQWPEITKSYFYKVWKRDVKGLKISRFHRFMICDTCCTLNQKLLRQSITQEERDMWQLSKNQHLLEVRNDRTLYECRILEAIQMKSQCLSITIDGSDNAKYGFPYFAVKTHGSQKGHKIQTKLYGAIVHGHWAATYLYSANMTGGTNVTIEVLHRVLSALQNEGTNIPRKLFLQLDNTVSTNKSKYVKAYLKSLVDCDLFEEIFVHYFQVGHTHCDIDQLFSRIAIYLLDKVVITFQDLLDACKWALSGMDGWMKYTERITHFCNFKDTIEPFLVPPHAFTGITKFRAFRFLKQDRKCLFQAKASILSRGDWHDFHYSIGEPQQITKDDIALDKHWFETAHFVDYTVKALPKKDGKEVEYNALKMSIKMCSQRIKDHLDNDEYAEQVIAGLYSEIESWRYDQVFPGTWDLSIYLNPLKSASRSITIPLGVQPDVAPETLRQAEQRLQAMETGAPLTLADMSPGMMVITKTGEDPYNPPFWIAEVLKTFADENHEHFGEVKVCWYATKVAKKKKKIGAVNAKTYLNGPFLTMAVVSNSKRIAKGRELQRANSYTDYIDVDSISYVFNRLTSLHKLPPKIVQSLIDDDELPLCVA
jgi:hypothetical protein